LAKSDGDLDLDMVSVAALPTATCSTDVIAHGLHGNSPAQLVWMTQTRCWDQQGHVLQPGPWPSFIEKQTTTAQGGTVEPPRNTVRVSNMVVVPCLTLCLEDDIDVLTPMYTLDVNFNIKQQGRVLRPRPWPSFKCHSEVACSKEPCPVGQGIIGRLSTFQPHERLNCYVVSYVLQWTSSFGGHYVQPLASLRIFWYEFYNIGRL
jgi:hypothetical protein